jgi:hypothetical protein
VKALAASSLSGCNPGLGEKVVRPTFFAVAIPFWGPRVCYE